MATLQVKNLPDELHAALGERARAAHVTMSEYVTRLLRRDLSRPSFSEWAAEVRVHTAEARDIDVLGALDGARSDYAADGREDV